MELKELKPLLHIHDRVNETRPLNFLMVMDKQEDTSFFSSDDFRFVGIFVSAMAPNAVRDFLHWRCPYSVFLHFSYEPGVYHQ